jgi:hypothetical protein
MKASNKQIQSILESFNALNGTKWVGIKEYKSVKSGEVANFVVNANFNYGNAVNSSIEILETLTDADFTAIADRYKVVNHEGEKYGSNAPAREYLATGKIAKEGTKARIKCLEGVKETKTLATICAEMIQAMLDNQNEETRSAQSIAQREKYDHVAKSVKRHKETKRLHIWAMANWKEVVEEGEYSEGDMGIETAQKTAIERYCKEVLKKQLPTTKYRNFVIEDNQLSEVAISGETFVFI